jgi:hypothetical protein
MEESPMPTERLVWRAGFLTTWLAMGLLGCNTPLLPRDSVRGTRVSSPNYVDGPAPLRMPSPDRIAGCERFEDELTGGEVFQMYCAQCHNRRPMFERPFANYQNVAAHMRTRANLTGKEYEKLVTWMRRVQDAPLPNPDTEPSPKRFVFSQPVNELQPEVGKENGLGTAAAPNADAALSERSIGDEIEK